MSQIDLKDFQKISKWTYETYTIVASMASGASVLPLINKAYEVIIATMETMYLPNESRGQKSVERIINKLAKDK